MSTPNPGGPFGPPPMPAPLTPQLLPFGAPVAGDPDWRLVVEFDPEVARQRLGRRRRFLFRQLVNLGITAVVLLVLYVWRRFSGAGFALVYGIVVLAGLGWVAFAGIAYLLARRSVAAQPTGTALVVDPGGVRMGDLQLTWPQVASMAIVRQGLLAQPSLQLVSVSGDRRTLPWEGLAVLPATLDSAVRAYSAGRHGVDLAGLDN